MGSRRCLWFAMSLFVGGCARFHTVGELDADVRPDGGVDAATPECELDSDCDDALACNGSERCVMGSCAAGEEVICDDGIDCTRDRCQSDGSCVFEPDPSLCEGVCDPALGCLEPPECVNDNECSDGLFCNGLELCLDGSCASGAPINCDDDDECTEDFCDAEIDSCMHRISDDPECRDCMGDPDCLDVCVFEDLGSIMGMRMAVGSTDGVANVLTPSCRRSTSGERAFRWRAPQAGTFAFDTNGSSYDTVMFVQERCSGPQLACDDDDGEGFQSRVVLELEAGQSIIVVIDGFGGREGDFVLNILPL